MIALRTPARGLALIEALVALLIMAFGMVALIGLQSSLRSGADLSKQRGEAVRLAQAQMETLRSYSRMQHPDPANPAAGALAFSDITDSDRVNAGDANSNANFMLSTRVTPSPQGLADLAAVRIRVEWKDRAGQDQFVLMDSFIAGAEPSLSGSLGLAPAAPNTQRPAGREAAIPTNAKDMGDGRSVFIPSAIDTVAWVFNNLTGVITSKCTVAMGKSNAQIVPEDLSNCQASFAYLLSGTVNFSISPPPYPAQSSLASLPFALRIATAPAKPGSASGPNAPAHECYPLGLSPSATSHVNFHCIVYPNADNNSSWYGRLILRNVADEVPPPGKAIDLLATQLFFTAPALPSISTNAVDIPVKVCRYSADQNGDRKIDNAEHPLDYAKVTGALNRQNFLVLQANSNCPSGSPAAPSQGQFLNTASVLHQPLGVETPLPP